MLDLLGIGEDYLNVLIGHYITRIGMIFAPECSVKNLYQLKSDHRAILISLQPRQRRCDRPFRCLASWFCHANFKEIIRKNWMKDTPIVDSLVNFKEVLLT